MEAALASRLTADMSPDPAITYAVDGLAGGATVAATVETGSLSRATLARRFEAAVGLSPKLWAGLARFQRAVGLLALGSSPLVDIALACGYADQSHMTRDFRRFAGITPSAYCPRSPTEPNHLAT
jgi:AraC-like DNA-binding protein